MTEKLIREASVDAKLLYQELSKMKPGDFVSYEHLSKIIGRDVRKHRGFLYTARAMAEREDGLTFGVILDEGLQCLNPAEIINTGDYAIRHIKNTAKRAAKRFRCIQDLSALPNEERIRFNTSLSILGVMTEMAKPSNIRRVESKVKETSDLLPYAKTLDAFK